MPKIGSDTTWGKSRARSGLDAFPNFRRYGWGAYEGKLACQYTDTVYVMCTESKGAIHERDTSRTEKF